MGSTKNKLLILSLGKGKISDGEKRPTYEKTRYQIGDVEPVEAEFIADPLIRSFDPDQIIVVGTVKSNWIGFYDVYGDSDQTKVCVLNEIMKENGIHTKESKLEAVNSKIDTIFQDSLIKEPLKGRKVRVLLTRYGISEEELSDNYRIISRVAESLEYDKENEVAFDITHSFRSIPLYNLIILNYLKEIAKYRIRITHVYYGNLESCSENNDISSIVDLHDLIQVLDLTNGVSEFKNTGNAVTLSGLLPQEDELYPALQKFDWASQINALDEMVESLDQLMEIVNNPREIKPSRYTDLRSMIREVIINKFFEGDSNEMTEFKTQSLGEKQFLLCRWYRNQNRYGQAIATALEALRSFLTPMYLRMENKPDTEKNCMKEEYRIAAVKRLSRMASYYESHSTKEKIQEMFCELEQKRRIAVKIRNNFAHNLDGNTGMDSGTDGIQQKQIVDQFIDELTVFREEIRNNSAMVESVYNNHFEFNVSNQHIQSERPIRMVISKEMDNFSQFYRQAANGNTIYDIYCLNNKIMEELNGNKLLDNAVFFERYFSRKNMNLKKVDIILHCWNLNDKESLYYAVVFSKLGVSYIYKSEKLSNGKLKMTNIPKIEIPVSEEFFHNYELPLNLEQLLKCDLEKVN